MKINISDSESYSIDLPNEITLAQLSDVSYKLNSLNKLFGKGLVLDSIKETKKFIVRKPRTQSKYAISFRKSVTDRHFVLELLKIYYSSMTTDEKRQLIEQKLQDMPYKHFSAKVWGIRERFDIKPEEVGLTNYSRKNGVRTN